MLVPAKKVVGVIGQKGDYIKKACEETKARIKILEGPPGTRERVVMVSAKEEPTVPLPPAVDGLLRVHKHFVGSKVSTSLLVPFAQARSLIGTIQQESNCIIRVLGTEELSVFALRDDRIVEVVGEPEDVHKAIGLIASHLRNYLVDPSMIEMQMQMPNPRMERMPPAAQPWIPPLQSYPPASLGSTPPPPRQFDKYYSYGREAPMHPSSSQPAPSIITEITQPMHTLLVSSISYIQRVSGATVTIQEARGMPGKMIVEISGTASQVQTAQRFIQYFMAQAAGQQQQTQHAPEAADYNSDAAHGSAAYTSNPPPSGQTGGFGSYYGY